MAVIESWFDQDLTKAVKVQYLDGNVFSADNQGNKVGVRVFQNGEAASLSGTISANIIRADGATVTQSGSFSGNEASIILPQPAYAVPGVISIIIKNTVSSVITTLCAVVATVYESTTSTIVDPGTIIPSVQALIDQIDTAVSSIPADYSSLWTKLAPAFSTSTAYVAGQYVTYNGGLYRFTTTHAAGSWASGDVVAVNLGGEITDLKSAINFAEEEYEIIDNWYDGHYYKLNDAPSTIDVDNPGTSTNYACLYFAVEPGDIIEYRGKGSSAARIYALLSSKSDTGNVLSITSRYNYEDRLILSIDNSDAKYIVFNADKRQTHIVSRIKNKHTLIAGTYLNNIVNEGEYYCWNQTIRNELYNVPEWVAGAFRMKVERLSPDTAGSTLAIMQTIYTNTTSKEYISISYRIARGNSPDTTFTDWMVIYDPDTVPFDITNTTVIPENADLDDYLTPGAYCCRSAAYSKTIDNVPLFVDSSFLLWVVNSRSASDESTYKRQILFANKFGTSTIYTRQLNTAGFGEWQLLIGSSSYESPLFLDVSSFVPAHRLSGSVKKTIRVGTNNVAHYWLQGRIADYKDYLANYPAKIAKWRNWLLKANADILFLQECEDWLDENHTVSAFDTLYTSFFDADTNIDPSPGESGLSSKARKKILNKLGINTNTGDPESVTSDGETQYFTWVIVNIPCGNNETIPVLLVNMHNFAHNKEAQRKDYLDALAAFIQNKNVQYFIIAGDTNAKTSTDRANLLAFCSSVNATPSNGGIIGWFSTANVEEQGSSYDNIIVSNNIRIDSIECDPVLVPSDTLHTDHTPVTVTISFMETQE